MSKSEYYQVVGLLVLAKRKKDEMEEIVKALMELTGELVDYGRCSDFAWGGNTNADDLLRKLNLTVKE